MATHTHRRSQRSLPRAVQRPPLVRDLEPDDRQKSLWVAKQHGHSVQTMLETYAAWLEGTTEADLGAIQKAMEAPATALATKVARPLPLPPPKGRQKVSLRCLQTTMTTRKYLNSGGKYWRREGFEPIYMSLILCRISFHAIFGTTRNTRTARAQH